MIEAVVMNKQEFDALRPVNRDALIVELPAFGERGRYSTGCWNYFVVNTNYNGGELNESSFIHKRIVIMEDYDAAI